MATIQKRTKDPDEKSALVRKIRLGIKWLESDKNHLPENIKYTFSDKFIKLLEALTVH
jgi:hypothetical protein